MTALLNINQALSAQAAADRPGWLVQRQADGLDRFQKQAWPTRRTEAFKYTPLRSLTDHEWQPTTNQGAIPGIQFDHWHDVRIEIRNGFLTNVPTLPDGVALKRFSELSEDERNSLSRKLESQAVDFLFDDLNQALVDDIYCLSVAANIAVSKPIHLDYAMSGDQQIVVSQFLILVDANAQATVAETFTAEGGAQFINANTAIVLSENARLTHYHLLLEEGDIRHVGRVSATLDRYADLNSFHMAAGGVLKRKDITVCHKGEGANLNLNGVYLPIGKEIIDYHTTLEHEVPHCTSEEIFRGIISDEARAIFNGRIHIHKDAQKSVAEMNNRNLLLSDKAEINTKPELEIYADDVRCAHGATIAQLDEKLLFYFQTRGISKAEAEVMLSFGFINELLEALTDDPVQQLLRPMLATLFAQKKAELARHII